MKKITILKREVLERTNFKKWRFKEVTQFTILHDNKVININHDVDYKNEKLKIAFNKILETSRKNDLDNFIKKLGRSENEKQLKNELLKILNKQ